MQGVTTGEVMELVSAVKGVCNPKTVNNRFTTISNIKKKLLARNIDI